VVWCGVVWCGVVWCGVVGVCEEGQGRGAGALRLGVGSKGRHRALAPGGWTASVQRGAREGSRGMSLGGDP
jgi:hypothetical protein